MNPCVVHKHQTETPVDHHHIWPLGEGGPDETWNIITVCPTGHREIHEYLRLLLKNNGKVSWFQRRKYGKRVRVYAETGYTDIVLGRVESPDDCS